MLMSNDITVMYSKKTDDWKTPSKLYKYFMDHGYVDVCPFQASEDYLLKEFHNSNLYCNPPYSKNKQFIEWLYKQMNNGCNIWILIPSRTDTRYFQKIMDDGMLLYFIKGRLRFNDSNMGAPFPSVLIHLSKHIHNDFKNSYMNGTVDEFIERNLI